MWVRRAVRALLLALVVIAIGSALPIRLHAPFTPAAAQAQPDCDGDGDGDQDLNEYSECYEPPPLPAHPFGDDQKQLFRDLVWQAWNTCTATGHPLPPPVELPGPPPPGQTALPSQVLQSYYAILMNQFASMCGDLGGLGVYAAGMLSVDPPDPHSATIPLARTPRVPHPAATACRRLKRNIRQQCRAFAAVAFIYAGLVKREAALAEAMAIAGNRFANEKLASANFSTATAASTAATAQLVAENTFAGELAAAAAQAHRAGATLAKVLSAIRLDARFTARELRAMRSALSALRGFPAGFVASLKRDALDPNAIRAMLAQQLAKSKVKPFDLIALLRQSSSTAALTAAYRSTTPSQLADLVAELTAQGVVNRPANIALNDDLQNDQAAPNAAARARAMQQFIADSRRLVKGPYSLLLQAAAQPLAA